MHFLFSLLCFLSTSDGSPLLYNGYYTVASFLLLYLDTLLALVLPYFKGSLLRPICEHLRLQPRSTLTSPGAPIDHQLHPGAVAVRSLGVSGLAITVVRYTVYSSGQSACLLIRLSESSSESNAGPLVRIYRASRQLALNQAVSMGRSTGPEKDIYCTDRVIGRNPRK